MYHSHLLVNVGDNPDRPDWNICRRWLRNLYRVHQRLAMAFPSSPPGREDWAAREKAYCVPFSPAGLPALRDLPADNAPEVADDDDAPAAQVHVPRGGHAGFLFRIDHPPDPLGGAGRRPVIVVPSAGPPDREY